MIGLLDLSQQHLVETALEGSGHALARFGRPEEAAHAVAENALPALIVETETCDARVRDLLASVRPHRVAVLVVARDRSVSSAVECLRSGASDYLASPFEYESLLRAVERLLDESAAGAEAAPEEVPFVTRDPDTIHTLELLRSVAASDATILIQGESGTGKELLARLVHLASPRRNRELVSVNCAALPAGLLESELFGHERGAFTGALSRVIGKFELAHQATILLDEIGELELALQAKLLRVVQEKQVQRLGARRPVDVDFRLVTTTNRNLAEEVRASRFREDLFYRLNVLPIRVKPLRERPDDVPLLVRHFLDQHASLGRPAPSFARETLQTLQEHVWPGNVRELENIVERMVLVRGGSQVRPEHLGLPTPSAPTVVACQEALPFRTVREMERWLIVQTLAQRQGNRTQTARELGISLRTLRNKINEYRIVEPETLPRSGIVSQRRGPADPAREGVAR